MFEQKYLSDSIVQTKSNNSPIRLVGYTTVSYGCIHYSAIAHGECWNEIGMTE